MSFFRHPITFIDIRYEDRLQLVREIVELGEAKDIEMLSFETREFLDDSFRISLEVLIEKEFCSHYTNSQLAELGLAHEIQIMDRGELLHTYRCEM